MIRPLPHPFVAGAWLCLAALTPGSAWSAPAPTPTSTATSSSEAGIAWAQLSANQRAVLAPLATDWATLSADSRKKWAEVALRVPNMPPAQQERVRERMREWAKMNPAQRVQARLNFQQTQQLPAQDRQASWEAYQALPPQERQALAAQAQPNAAASGASGAKPASGNALRAAAVDAQAPKSNLVKGPAAKEPGVKPVAPAVVQSNVGASTRLVNAPTTPPSHLSAGQPKIAANSSQVDRTTLLPKKPPAAPATSARPVSASQTAPAASAAAVP